MCRICECHKCDLLDERGEVPMLCIYFFSRLDEVRKLLENR
jgi:hypothetical protein